MDVGVLHGWQLVLPVLVCLGAGQRFSFHEASICVSLLEERTIECERCREGHLQCQAFTGPELHKNYHALVDQVRVLSLLDPDCLGLQIYLSNVIEGKSFRYAHR